MPCALGPKVCRRKLKFGIQDPLGPHIVKIRLKFLIKAVLKFVWTRQFFTHNSLTADPIKSCDIPLDSTDQSASSDLLTSFISYPQTFAKVGKLKNLGLNRAFSLVTETLFIGRYMSQKQICSQEPAL